MWTFSSFKRRKISHVEKNVYKRVAATMWKFLHNLLMKNNS